MRSSPRTDEAVTLPAERMAVRRTTVALRRLHDRLAAQPSLAPSPQVDELFRELVDLVVTMDVVDVAAVLADPAVLAIRPDLQRLCGAGETELERAWASRIAGSPRPWRELERFPYLENYRLLTLLERSALGGAGLRRPRQVAFLGAGPLPLTAMLLAGDHELSVDAFDRDTHALTQARSVVGALGVHGMRLRHADALRCPDLHRYDAVVLAALVGTTPATKRVAVERVHARMRPGAILVARSAHGARSLLYPELELRAMADLELLSVVHPYNQVVNSIVVARKPVPGRPERQERQDGAAPAAPGESPPGQSG